jgi:hypothetical protein
LFEKLVNPWIDMQVATCQGGCLLRCNHCLAQALLLLDEKYTELWWKRMHKSSVLVFQQKLKTKAKANFNMSVMQPSQLAD